MAYFRCWYWEISGHHDMMSYFNTSDFASNEMNHQVINTLAAVFRYYRKGLCPAWLRYVSRTGCGAVLLWKVTHHDIWMMFSFLEQVNDGTLLWKEEHPLPFCYIWRTSYTKQYISWWNWTFCYVLYKRMN